MDDQQIFPLDKLHDDVDVLFVFMDFVELDEILRLLSYSSQYPDFVENSLDVRCVAPLNLGFLENFSTELLGGAFGQNLINSTAIHLREQMYELIIVVEGVEQAVFSDYWPDSLRYYCIKRANLSVQAASEEQYLVVSVTAVQEIVINLKFCECSIEFHVALRVVDRSLVAGVVEPVFADGHQLRSKRIGTLLLEHHVLKLNFFAIQARYS